MSSDWFQDVRDFHEKFGCWTQSTPDVPPYEVEELRRSLEAEEFAELQRAVEAEDLVETADAVVDLIYVLLGRCVSSGIDIRPVWDAVHAANLRKVGGGEREDGKILKPKGWEPANVAEILAAQKGMI
jgi:predicted HAD superfamily Cof-like phosphohydrolase